MYLQIGDNKQISPFVGPSVCLSVRLCLSAYLHGCLPVCWLSGLLLFVHFLLSVPFPSSIVHPSVCHSIYLHVWLVMSLQATRCTKTHMHFSLNVCLSNCLLSVSETSNRSQLTCTQTTCSQSPGVLAISLQVGSVTVHDRQTQFHSSHPRALHRMRPGSSCPTLVLHPVHISTHKSSQNITPELLLYHHTFSVIWV